MSAASPTFLASNKRFATRIELKGVPKETLYQGVAGVFVEGYASVSEPKDRYGDTLGLASDVFRESLVTYFQLNPIILYNHGLHPTIGNIPFGRVTAYKFDDVGLWIKPFIEKPTWEPMFEVYKRILTGGLRTFSIAGIFDRDNTSKIMSVDLVEISIEPTPAMPYAVFDVASKGFSVVGRNGKKHNFNPKANDRLDRVMKSLDYWQGKATQLGQPTTNNYQLRRKVAKYLRYNLSQLERLGY